MSEMVERVARALFKAENGTDAHPDYWSSNPRAPRYFERARAAIEAMRYPTDVMCEAGYYESFPDGRRNGRVADVWKGMIDEALK